MLGAVALYAGLLVVLVAAVFYMQADTGTLVIHASAEVKELLADKAISLRDVKTERVHTLQPGSHDLPPGDYEIDVAKLPPEIVIKPNKRFSLQHNIPVKLTFSLAAPEESVDPDVDAKKSRPDET